MTEAMAKGTERGRCVTGVEGLDIILGGGIPINSAVLVSGGPGTGKTSLAIEFLMRGAVQGESGLLITTMESEEKLLSNAPPLDFFDEGLLKKGVMSVVALDEIRKSAGISATQIDEAGIEKLVGAISKVVSAAKVKRLVIDTVDTLLAEAQGAALDAILLTSLSELLYKNGCTALLISSHGATGTIGAAVDGIILLGNHERHGDILRTMQVLKMKGTSHSRAKYVIDLTPAGVLVTPLLRGGS
jgi:circadian clock protein KaiC